MKLERHDEVALLRMEAGKANAIQFELLDALDGLWSEFEETDARAAVLTGYGSFFCAGLDLVTLSKLDRSGMRRLMRRFHEVFLRIFRSPRPVVGAVNGHAIAGGCVLALMTDHRVFCSEGAKIGLNETQLGVGLPSIVVEGLRVAVPPAAFGPAAYEGGIFGPERALELGLVHELVAADSVVERSIEKGTELARIGAQAYAHVKASHRRAELEYLDGDLSADEEAWLDTWFSAEAQERIGAAVARLT